MKKYLCIHGHFYQPPRENPWLDEIEKEASAAPYHDWNERVTRECYGPNACARIYGRDDRILALVNNYEYMSFNFGPTLLSWLERRCPRTYGRILSADQKSRSRFGGHGSALAQVYNHIIMPLASRRDRLTQIRWGLADFRRRFGRAAEGMWLAETAVDTGTLELLAAEGVKFTILSPGQARSVRPLARDGESPAWEDVPDGGIDTTRPYRVRLGPGKGFIDVFFYHGPLSRAVAFERILASGSDLLSRIEQAFPEPGDGVSLVNLATDGESYGHHFKFGDLALAWLFRRLEADGGIELINYGYFLERFPPRHEVRIVEKSSWSCAHGVERWRSDCGCSVSRNPAWNQAWRAPLRRGLDWLAGELSAVFEDAGGALLRDPWAARDDYIRVILDPSDRQKDLFLDRHRIGPPGEKARIDALRLLESQRMALYMFTSCGWFFDDISGLESTQILKYAARAVDLARPWAAKDLEAGLLDFLEEARSNDPDMGTGRRIYRTRVMPSRMDPSRAAAHQALAARIAGPGKGVPGSSLRVETGPGVRIGTRDFSGVLGTAAVQDTRTGAGASRVFLVLQSQWPRVSCRVGKAPEDLDLFRLARAVRRDLAASGPEAAAAAFSRRVRGVKRYDMTDLTADTRDALVRRAAGDLMDRIGDLLENDRSVAGMTALLEKTGMDLPGMLEDLFRVHATVRLSALISSDRGGAAADREELRDLFRRYAALGIPFRRETLSRAARDALLRSMERLGESPGKAALEDMIRLLDLAGEFRLEPDLWECRNRYDELRGDGEFMARLGPGLLERFRRLGERLGFLIVPGPGT